MTTRHRILFGLCGAAALLGSASGMLLVITSWPGMPTGDTRADIIPLTALALAVICSVIAIVMLIRRLMASELSLARDLRALPREFTSLVRRGYPNQFFASERQDLLGVAARRFQKVGQKLREDLSGRAEIERLAVTDALTNLPNRRGLMGYLNTRLAELEGDRTLAVLHVDLDHFKTINDTLGHDAGDAVLQEATQRMSAVLRGSDMLARLGGDEFIIVANGILDQDVLGVLCDRLVEQFATPMHYLDEVCSIGASVGAVLIIGSDGPFEAKRVLSDADVALCDAKVSGRNRRCIFTPEMAATLKRRSRQSKEIREALLDGEFRAWYQPVIDYRSGALIGVELLSRWEHPEKGLLRPDAFLLSAETHNLLEEIGLQVLEQAAQQIRKWTSNNLIMPPLHINMTRGQLIAPGVVDKVSWILDDGNIPPNRVSLEVNEQSCEGRSVELVFANLARFRALGAETTLDDFGGLTSSLRNILQLGASYIKCDRALASDLLDPEKQAETEKILKGLVGMARSLEIEVIAKGVENIKQIKALRRFGITQMQGDALAPAMAGEEFVKWLMSGSANRVTLASSGSRA